MRKKRILSTLALVLFLCLSLAYCQELTSDELKIFYDTTWEMLQIEYQLGADPTDEEGRQAGERMQQFLSQKGITEAQLQDIVERGNKMPFSAAEEQLAQALKTEITDDLTPDEIMDTLYDLADRYGMSMGQVSNVFMRNIRRE